MSRRPFSVQSLGKVVSLLILAGECHRILRPWLDPQRRQEVRRVLELCRGSLPEFSESAVIELRSEAVEALPTGGNLDLTGLASGDQATVRTVQDRLEKTVGAVRDLEESLAGTISALSDVLSVLGLKPRPLVVRGLGKLQELLALVGSSGPLRRSWLDPQKRSELQKVIEKGRELESLNSEARLTLLDRLLPDAFQPELSALAQRCRAYRSGWSRLLPTWWLLRPKVARLYARDLPEADSLVEDMREVEEYHRRSQYLNQLKRQYADSLALNVVGEPDWDQTSEGLRNAERFDPLLKAFPDLKEVLLGPGGVDRESLEAGLETFAIRYRELSRAATIASVELNLGASYGLEGDRAKLSTNDFAKWFGQERSSFERRLAPLTTISPLLKPDRDLPIAELASRLPALQSVCQAALHPLADHFLLDQNGELEWDRTLNGIAISERLDPLFRVFPGLGEILVDPVGIDRGSLEELLEALSRASRDYHDAAGSAVQYIDLASIKADDGQRTKMSSTDLLNWIGSKVEHVEVVVGALDRYAKLIQPGHDVLLAKLPERLRSLQDLRRANSRLILLTERIGKSHSGEGKVVDRDWSEVRHKAEWALRFLDQYSDHPPEHLVRAATTPEDREQLEQSLRSNLAMRSPEFEESWAFLLGLFDPVQSVSTGIKIGSASIPELHKWVERRVQDIPLTQEWLKFCELKEQIESLGLLLLR